MKQSPKQVLAGLNPSNLPVALKVNAQGELVIAGGNDQDNLSHNFSANSAGLALQAGPGVLKGLDVNTVGVTSAIVLYDGTSTGGTKLGTWSTLAQVALQLNLPFTVGLFAVLTGGTPADVTVSWRPQT